MDAQVGKVIDSLDRLGLSQNTVIVFTSDHGYHMGEHGLYQKMSLFEESARVPLLLVAPGVAGQGQKATTPVSHIDLFPTLAELCQVEKPANLQGQSLVPILKDPSQPGRGWAITQVTRSGLKKSGRSFGYSLRTDRWRYTEWDRGEQGVELYDHEADPRELTNLAARPEWAGTRQQLAVQLKEAIQTTMPSSGETPAIQPGLWAPILTQP
jgi:iduronate 2-sulfatase